MIYLFHGSDVDTVRSKAFAWVSAARKKEPSLMYTRLGLDEISEGSLIESAGSGGLFVKRLLVLIDNPFAKIENNTSKSTGSILETYIDMLAESDNAIVILAPALTATRAKKILPKVTKEYCFNSVNKIQERGFNSGLVNALASRSGIKLWVEIMRSFRAGDPPEKIHGLLHWKVRNLMVKGSGNWSKEELRALSVKLISVLIDARNNNSSSLEALERFALSL